MTGVTIQLESWADFWPEAAPLAAQHTLEADSAMPERPYSVDSELIARLEAAGAFLLITARRAGALLGYQTWALAPDIQSRGTLTGQQWAWYILPGESPGLAAAMYDFSEAELRRRGVGYLLSSVPMSGRGTRLGRFYLRKGYRLVAQQFYLWLGD